MAEREHIPSGSYLLEQVVALPHISPERLLQWRQEKAQSLSWHSHDPAELLAALPPAVGDLQPELVKLGTWPYNSSLIATLAVAINSVRRTRSAASIFKQLSVANRFSAKETNASQHVPEILHSLRPRPGHRSYKIPILGEVNIEPLMPEEVDEDRPFESFPLLRAFEAVTQGGVVVMPIEGDLGGLLRRRRGHIYWGAITGYWAHVITGDSPDRVTEGRGLPENIDAELSVQTDVTVAAPALNAGLTAHINVQTLAEQLGEGHLAQVVSSRRGSTARS